jgi:hypothetical protein
MRLTYANVMSSLGVFLALGGVSYAATQLEDGSVRSRHIVDGQVAPADVTKSLRPTAIFRFRDSAVQDKGTEPTVLIEHSVVAGQYAISAEVGFSHQGPGYLTRCWTEFGAGGQRQADATVGDSSTDPGFTAFRTLTLSGVTNGKLAAGKIRLVCIGAGPGTTYGDARLVLQPLVGLSITRQP